MATPLLYQPLVPDPKTTNLIKRYDRGVKQFNIRERWFNKLSPSGPQKKSTLEHLSGNTLSDRDR
jgi:hypothetical protein